jgi:hypothetical protein
VADMERGAPPYWLTLIGINGCGKSMLMRQVFKEAQRVNPGNPSNNRIWPPNWQEFGGGVNVYTNTRPYCLLFDEGAFAGQMRDGDYYLPRNLRSDYFVGFDELGVARDPTNFIADAVTQLCENRLGRWTTFASNWSLKDIAERMDARISSRMIRDGNVVVSIRAGDYAARKRC